MKREDVKRYQDAQISLLDYASALCEKLEITYFLGFGTLLGAIRHKGFIPWDPDIDIMMMRSDYEKFCDYCEKTDLGPVFIDTYNTDKLHVSPHAIIRLKGTHVHHKEHTKRRFESKNNQIYIDVFPLDNVPDDPNLEEKQINDLIKIERLVTLKQAPIYIGKTNTIKQIAKNLTSLFLSYRSFNKIIKERNNIMTRYNSHETKQVAAFVDPTKWNPKHLQFPREWFYETVKVPFEGKMYNAPKNYDAFLKKRYGDYMALPPEDQRWGYLDNALDYVDYGVYKDQPISLPNPLQGR